MRLRFVNNDERTAKRAGGERDQMMKTFLKSTVGYHAVMVQLHERAGKNWNEHMCVETALSMVTITGNPSGKNHACWRWLIEDRLPGDKKETS